MYKVNPLPNGFALDLDGQTVAIFYCEKTADLTANLLNIIRMAPITSRMQAG